MPRKKCCRKVSTSPISDGFTPLGVGVKQSLSILLNLDEFEAIRLADHLALYHEEAAERMGISRATFGRIIGEARSKVADALVNGKRLQIANTNAHTLSECISCGHENCRCNKEKPCRKPNNPNTNLTEL